MPHPRSSLPGPARPCLVGGVAIALGLPVIAAFPAAAGGPGAEQARAAVPAMPPAATPDAPPAATPDAPPAPEPLSALGTWGAPAAPLVAAGLSLFVPGAGQIAAGAPVEGALFAAIEIAAIGGLWAGTANRSLVTWGLGAGLLVAAHALAPAHALLLDPAPPPPEAAAP